MMEPWNKGFLLMGLGELNNSFTVALLKNDENISNKHKTFWLMIRNTI